MFLTFNVDISVLFQRKPDDEASADDSKKAKTEAGTEAGELIDDVIASSSSTTTETNGCVNGTVANGCADAMDLTVDAEIKVRKVVMFLYRYNLKTI